MTVPTEPDLDLEKLRDEKGLAVTLEQAAIIEFADKVCSRQLEEHRAGRGHFFPCPNCVALKARIDKAKAAAIEECIKVVQQAEVEEGTEAEGLGEPEFSIHAHAELQLHHAVVELCKLKDQQPNN